jgi:hypothetical protein
MGCNGEKVDVLVVLRDGKALLHGAGTVAAGGGGGGRSIEADGVSGLSRVKESGGAVEGEGGDMTELETGDVEDEGEGEGECAGEGEGEEAPVGRSMVGQRGRRE